MIEKRHRIEDALEAVKAARDEGIVPGGGTALLLATQDLKLELDNSDQNMGVKIICDACTEPIRQMATNAAQSPDLIINAIKNNENKGFDFKNGELVDMLEQGIVDPVKVTRCALQNAASVATTLFTTNHAIVEA